MTPIEPAPGPATLPSPETEAILKEAAALRAALERGRTLRRILALLFLVFVVGFTWAFWRLGAQTMDEKYLKEVQVHAQKRLDKNSDAYLRDVQQIVERVRPHVVEAISKQTTKDTPAYLRAMEEQGTKFNQNLQRDLLARIDVFQEKAIAKHQSLFEKEFPTLRDERMKNHLAVNLRTAAERVAQKYYVQDLKNSMDELYTTWDNFPAAKTPGKNDPRLEEQFTGALLNLTALRLTQPPPIQP